MATETVPTAIRLDIVDQLVHLISYHDKSVIQFSSGAIDPHTRQADPYDLVMDHIDGHRRLGAYCPNTDGMTTFAVIDIDAGDDHSIGVEDPNWELAKWEVALCAADLEFFSCHSRSGIGYHIWIIFETPVLAKDVRHMLHSIREQKRGVDIFPKQNIAKKKGYGNFVWLPFFDNTVVMPSQFGPDMLDFLHTNAAPTPAPLDAEPPSKTPTPTTPTTGATRFSNTATVGGRPVPPLSPIVEIMLLYIDSTPYDDWIKVLFALYATYGDAAKDTAREWSSYADNYDAVAFDEKWDQAAEEEEIEIKINSVIHMAKQDPNPWDGREWDQWCEQYYENLVTLQGSRALDGGSQEEMPVPATASDYDIVIAIEEHIDNRDIMIVGGEDKLWEYSRATGIWNELTEREIIHRFIDPYNGTFARPYATSNGQMKYPPINMTGTLMRNILAILRERTYDVSKPFPEAKAGVTFRNGFLSPDGLEDHSPEHYSRDFKPYDFEPATTNPFFEAWLREAIEDHAGYLATQEFAGACLMGAATQYQKSLLLYGPGATGKSVFLKLISRFFGEGKVCNVPPQDFNREHLRARLSGRKLNIVEELPNRSFTDTSNLKSLIAGGTVEAREKYGRTFSFVNRAGIAISANILPVSASTEDGIWRRILMVSMPTVVHKSQRIPDFENKLSEGYHPCWFAAWAYEGFLRLRKQGEYTESETGEEYLDEWKEQSDHVLEFVDDMLRAPQGSDDYTSWHDVYAAYKRWCRETGNLALTKRKLTSRVVNLGFERKRTAGSKGILARLVDFGV